MDDPVLVVFALTFPILLVATAVVALLLWRGTAVQAGPAPAAPAGRAPHRGVLGDVRTVAVWLVLSAATLLGAFIVGFAIVHALLFSFGTSVATVALVLGIVIMICVPVAWAILLRRRHRDGRI